MRRLPTTRTLRCAWCPHSLAGAPCPGGPAEGCREAMRGLAAGQVAAKRTELLAEMEQSLEDDLRRAAQTDVRDVRQELAAALQRTARSVVLRLLRAYAIEMTAANVAAPAAGAGGGQEPLFQLPAAVQEAAPRFAGCGGQQRMFVVASEALSEAITPNALGEKVTTPPTVIVDPQADMLICHEIEDLSLKRIASAVLDQRFQVVEAASRLHTRTDVQWVPL